MHPILYLESNNFSSYHRKSGFHYDLINEAFCYVWERNTTFKIVNIIIQTYPQLASRLRDEEKTQIAGANVLNVSSQLPIFLFYRRYFFFFPWKVGSLKVVIDPKNMIKFKQKLKIATLLRIFWCFSLFVYSWHITMHLFNECDCYFTIISNFCEMREQKLRFKSLKLRFTHIQWN